MFNKTRILLFTLFTSMFLVSCGVSLPKDTPSLGMDIDMTQLNTRIKVTAPKSVNSYKIGSTLELETVNLSNQVLKFRIDEIQIFRIENNEWQKVPNRMKTMVLNDPTVSPNEVSSVAELTLEPNGVFPGYKQLVGVLPDVKSDESVFLRIFVFAHDQDPENLQKITVGAFVDVSLKP